MKNDQEYIIVEIIPEAISPDKGNLVQISALRLKGLQLLDRFDCRLSEDKICNLDIRELISYDVDKFQYFDSTKSLLDSFQKWVVDLPIYILDNEYTKNFLASISNEKRMIHDVLGMEYSDDFIDKIIDKYHLEPSNYIVDLLYEAFIYESNH
ncbi:MAG: hypothetical protein PUB18_01145 [bacterium]|nr:hypothetical protein [bacterium]